MIKYICITLCLIMSSIVHAQPAFNTGDWNTSIGTSFLTYSYGYGDYLDGVPGMTSFEYGLHPYLGVGMFGGVMYRSPVIDDYRYKQWVYGGGFRINVHFYNIISDVLESPVSSDRIDMYLSINIGMDHTDTNLPINPKTVYYIGIGFGLRAYPFKSQRIGFIADIGHSVITPMLLGVTLKL